VISSRAYEITQCHHAKHCFASILGVLVSPHSASMVDSTSILFTHSIPLTHSTLFSLPPLLTLALPLIHHAFTNNTNNHTITAVYCANQHSSILSPSPQAISLSNTISSHNAHSQIQPPIPIIVIEPKPLPQLSTMHVWINTSSNNNNNNSAHDDTSNNWKCHGSVQLSSEHHDSSAVLSQLVELLKNVEQLDSVCDFEDHVLTNPSLDWIGQSQFNHKHTINTNT